MELRVFRFFLTCYLTCTLCRYAISGSTLTEVFSIINNTSQSDARKSEIGNTGTERSIVTETRLDEVILKDDQSKIEIPHLSTVTSDFKKAKCSRYCIEQLENNKGFEDINLFWLFADQQNEEEYFSIENSPNLKIFRSSDNKNSTILDNCRIYLNLNCDIINKERNLITQNKLYLNSEFNQQREKFKNYFSNTTPEFSILVHTPNLSGYTETNFQVDTNVIELIINIFGNFSAVITIPINRTIERPGMVMSSASIYNEKGVVIGARNLPGRWCVKLTGVENSKYDFYVIAYYKASEENRKNNIINTNSTNEINRKTNFDTYEAFDKKHTTTENKASTIINEINFNEMKQIRENTIDGTNSMFLINHTMNRKPKFARSTKIIVSTSNDKTMAGDFSDTSFFSHESSAVENINYFILRNNSLMSYGDFQILPNATSIKQQQKIQARSSEVASLNEDTEDAKMKSSMSEIVPMQMTNSDQSQKLSTQFAKINDDPFERRKILLEVNANSKLIAVPGTTHRVVFDATNSCILPVRYAIRARSSPLRIVNMQPSY
ncbi:uncharacterized protein LOC105424741 isoform X2 [Pogonomyrmex barbatus]|uniref:Uncharacterized protein LOC105424741 isoform X2 n=1 Tax=Pogonomyrmex barbatus TaxID=144034 RepID=A0A6I9VW89_9HYME|nr:uncharacterized protein LOC105424741 isoform X2 [Pogonomyrmex barbatus]